MADGKKEEMKLPSLDELFTTQEERDDAKLKRIHEIPLSEIDPFPDHPFKVRDDEDMDNLVESIRAKGMITPCMVRRKKDGRYELVSGHRRMRACEILGMDKLRCEIADLSRDEATILMVESNFQRSKILPSEKAFAYKMRLDAMKMLVSRMRENQRMGRNFGGAPVEPQLSRASEHLSKSYGSLAGHIESVPGTELIDGEVKSVIVILYKTPDLILARASLCKINRCGDCLGSFHSFRMIMSNLRDQSRQGFRFV